MGNCSKKLSYHSLLKWVPGYSCYPLTSPPPPVMVTHPFSFPSSYPLLVCVSLTGLKLKPHFHSGLWKGEKLWRLFGPLRSPRLLFSTPTLALLKMLCHLCITLPLHTFFPILVTWTQALPASVLFSSGAPANRGCRSWLIAPCHLRIPTLAAIYNFFLFYFPHPVWTIHYTRFIFRNCGHAHIL